MATEAHNAELNQLVIDLGRSLLQYVSEAWPWISAGEAETRSELDKLIDRQSNAVGRITALLAERGWPIEFGSYPTEYTDLHYVSLEFLLGQLVQNADELVDEIEDVIERCRDDDPEAAELLDDVLRDQQYIANKLRDLAASRRRQQLAESSPE